MQHLHNSSAKREQGQKEIARPPAQTIPLQKVGRMVKSLVVVFQYFLAVLGKWEGKRAGA